jgi:hypothetical protein
MQTLLTCAVRPADRRPLSETDREVNEVCTSAMQVWKFPSPAKLAAARGRIRSAGSSGSPAGSRGGSFSSTQREGSIRGRPPTISRRLNVSQRVLRKQSVQVVELPLAKC